MSVDVIRYKDPDPIELNPHIFKGSSARPLNINNSNGPYIVREMMEKYLNGQIEAGKPAYLNAVVLAADKYLDASISTQDTDAYSVCAICRIPGWDATPSPQGARSCIPSTSGLIFGDTARADRNTFSKINWNIINTHQIYFPSPKSNITLQDLLPNDGEIPSPGQIAMVKVVKVTFANFLDFSRPEILSVSDWIPGVVATDPAASMGTPVTTTSPGPRRGRRSTSRAPSTYEAEMDIKPETADMPPLLTGKLFPMPPANNSPAKSGTAVQSAGDPIWVPPNFPEEADRYKRRSPVAAQGKEYTKDNIGSTLAWKYPYIWDRAKVSKKVKFIGLHWPATSARRKTIPRDAQWAVYSDNISGGRISTHHTLLRRGISVAYDVDWSGMAARYVVDPFKHFTLHGGAQKGPDRLKIEKLKSINGQSIGIECLNPVYAVWAPDKYKNAPPGDPNGDFDTWWASGGLTLKPRVFGTEKSTLSKNRMGVAYYFCSFGKNQTYGRNFNTKAVVFPPIEQFEATWKLVNSLCKQENPLSELTIRPRNAPPHHPPVTRYPGGPYGPDENGKWWYHLGYTGAAILNHDHGDGTKGFQVAGHFRWSNIKQDDYFMEYYCAMRNGRQPQYTPRGETVPNSKGPSFPKEHAYKRTALLFWEMMTQKPNFEAFGAGKLSDGWPPMYRTEWLERW